MEEKDNITTSQPTQPPLAPVPVNRIVPIKLETEMKKSFISYAMAVIINRALPDVRDGLKPVHRRILYSMDELGLQPDKPFRKSARIVGDCLGKYHPHGDSSVYDAMVRLAQDFSTRYMLVEGHGNFGSVDGDGAAAMRYTEARLSKMASEMMADIEKDTVDFMPNFDETLMQPTVLPSRFPNILVNGSGGIAVGMATNIPPHNLGETIDALCALIDDPEIDSEGLMQYLPGPDFPTGGIIMGLSGIASAYRTGRGRIVVRARAEIEAYGIGKSRIIITEIPYQVNKARLVERIAELVHEKRVEGISDLRDETDRTGMRVVIELKKDVNANVILNQLYKHTDLQSTFGVINPLLLSGASKDRRDPAHHLRSQPRQGTAAYFRRPDYRARQHRRNRRSDQEVRQPQRSQREADCAFRALRAAGTGNSGHASPAPHRSGTRQDHGRGPHAARARELPAVDSRRRKEAARHHQGRSAGHQGTA